MSHLPQIISSVADTNSGCVNYVILWPLCDVDVQHLGNLSLVHFIQWNKSTMVKIYAVRNLLENFKVQNFGMIIYNK